jgi:hypothetical protein
VFLDKDSIEKLIEKSKSENDKIINKISQIDLKALKQDS